MVNIRKRTYYESAEVKKKNRMKIIKMAIGAIFACIVAYFILKSLGFYGL